MSGRTDRHNQPSGDTQLLFERLGHDRSSGRYQDPIERRSRRQPVASIADQNLDVRDTQLSEHPPCRFRQASVSFDGNHTRRQL